MNEWPLVGRGEELAVAVAELDRPGANGLLLAGNAGVGKSRVAVEILELAQARGLEIAMVRGTESGRAVPLGAFVPLLPARSTRRHTPEATVEMLQWTQACVVGEHERLVLGVDDAHALDDASAVVVHQLAADPRVFVVGTLRTDAVDVPAAITGLWKDAVIPRLELQALSKEEVAALLAAVLGAVVSGAAVHAIWQKTLGNPLFLREVLLAALAQNALIDVGGLWELAGPLPVGTRVAELVDARLLAVEAPTRAVVEVLAIGGPLPLDVLTQVVDSGSIEAAEQNELVRLAGDTVVVGHPLYADAVRTRLGTVHARRVKAALAMALAGPQQQHLDSVRYATLALDAELPVPPGTLVDAATEAFSRGDPAVAERFARAAVAAGGGSTAELALADALWRQELGEESLAVLERIQPGDDVQRTDIAVLAAFNLWLLDRVADGCDALRVAETEVRDPHCKVRLSALWASWLNFAGDARQALAISRSLAETPELPASVLLNVFSALGPALAFSGRSEEALAVAVRAYDPGLQPFDEIPVSASWAGATMLLAQWLCGFHRDAHAVALAAYESSLPSVQPGARVFTAAMLGCAALDRGELATALAWFHEGSVASADTLDMQSGGVVSRAGIALVKAMTGAPDEARHAVPAPVDLRAFNGWATPFCRLASAWTAAAAGKTSAARRQLLDAASDASRHGLFCFEVMALLDVARLEGAVEVAPRLAELATIVDGPRAELAARYADALVATDAGALDAASEAFETQGFLLLAAESAAHAARACHDAGLLGRAHAASARQERCISGCQGARSPALQAAVAPPQLTRREREIAVLAAGGLSSRQIADDLVLSTRTVESHLARVYSKLGITSRTELASTLGLEVGN